MSITASNAKELCEALGITDDDATLLQELEPPTKDQLQETSKVNVESVSSTFSPSTTAAIISDPKLELPKSGDEITQAANRVRSLAHLEGVFQNAYQAVHTSARQDCALLAEVASSAYKQIVARLPTNPQLKDTYASLIAYQNARYPGRKTKPTKPAPVPAPTPNPSKVA
jgi:hypothetical protein